MGKKGVGQASDQEPNDPDRESEKMLCMQHFISQTLAVVWEDKSHFRWNTQQPKEEHGLDTTFQQ